jgi:hypothetical protein
MNANTIRPLLNSSHKPGSRVLTLQGSGFLVDIRRVANIEVATVKLDSVGDEVDSVATFELDRVVSLE